MVLKQVIGLQGKHIAPVKLKALFEQAWKQGYTAIGKGDKRVSHVGYLEYGSKPKGA
jgi:hypothetical protein